MPTLIQLEDLESLALNALRKVLTTTENPTLLTKAASIILRYCKSSPSQRAVSYTHLTLPTNREV